MSDETQLEAALKFLAKDVDAPPRQLVVQVRDDEVERDWQFSVHCSAAADADDDDDDDDDNSSQDARNTHAAATECHKSAFNCHVAWSTMGPLSSGKEGGLDE